MTLDADCSSLLPVNRVERDDRWVARSPRQGWRCWHGLIELVWV